ncbi:hypothetical protein GGR28_001896 [Lewinella aquimaris]|uniref:Uncharacterized protein n=1 Tax=Neolewinella aquimaris TaxID=1835722 RepID=A0A840EEA8_9BACT|nr:hypothetical protein [Neolewinella aquimaris]MBB4079276.1 hypothetical protein [Neolewinella aquimaris]
MLGGTQYGTIVVSNSGQRNFRLVTKNASGDRVEVGPSGCGGSLSIGALDGSLITGEQPCSAASFRTNGSLRTYVFKTPQANQSTQFIFWRLTAPVRQITSVTSSVSGETSAPQQSVVMEGRLGNNTQTTNNGQTMYIRYSDDNFLTSFVVAMVNNNNGTFTGNIPGEGLDEGETVKYYLFTSATSTTNPAVTAANADLRTITYNNNGGSNFSFLVTGAAAVT